MTAQLAISLGVTVGAILFGLALVRQIPRPSTIAAAPEFLQADFRARQLDDAVYARRVLIIRLAEIGHEREAGE